MSRSLPNLPRREFLRQACCAGVGTLGMFSAMSQLRLVGALAADGNAVRTAAASAGGDYKALVCFFLNGGNDGNSILVPTDEADYAAYAKARGDLAILRKDLRAITPRLYRDGRAYGLNPNLAEVADLFDQGKVAFVGNVGTLVRPTTMADYTAGRALPLQLYSHLDQSIQWQSSIVDQPIFRTGWGGRMADLLQSMNENSRLSMAITLGGSSYFQVGEQVAPYAVDSGGADLLNGFWGSGREAERYQATKRLLAAGHPNVIGSAFAGATGSAVDSAEFLWDALNKGAPLKTVFASDGTSQRLRMVARLIGMAPSLGLRRQVFFVNIGGYDVHAAQVTAHATLLRELSRAMGAFYEATVELGVADKVTSFTASDFGRSYNPNADGTDHAWGNIQWVMGGAVAGREVYGKMPSLEVGAPDDTGRGRWIPSTSVDEYNAVLARWFGVSEANLPTVLPNIGRFARANLGFLSPA
jgi:uncharacterized protein (DUF1501 family)